MMGQSDVTLCPWDGDSGGEEDEEWLFSSIKEYSHLYMYSLYSTNMRPVTATMVRAPGGHGVGPPRIVQAPRQANGRHRGGGGSHQHQGLCPCLRECGV